MCVNYTPTRLDKLAYFNATGLDLEDYWREVWQDYTAPLIKVGSAVPREAVLASYGMIPQNRLPKGVRFSTMNARAETIGQLRSFASAWRACQFCLVPMSNFFEPNYESGKAIRWKIGIDEPEFAVAGLYRFWEMPSDNNQVSHACSFTQITINADDHPMMRRFHKPGDEKRSLVIIPQSRWDDWLHCKDPEIARSFLTNFPAEKMWAEAAPIEQQKKSDKKISTDETNQLGLF